MQQQHNNDKTSNALTPTECFFTLYFHSHLFTILLSFIIFTYHPSYLSFYSPVLISALFHTANEVIHIYLHFPSIPFFFFIYSRIMPSIYLSLPLSSSLLLFIHQTRPLENKRWRMLKISPQFHLFMSPFCYVLPCPFSHLNWSTIRAKHDRTCQQPPAAPVTEVKQ